MSLYNLPDADDATQQSNRMINNYFQLFNEVSQLRQRFDSIESHIQTMMNNQEHMMRMLSRIATREKPRDINRKQIQKSNSKKNLLPTTIDASKLLNLQEALQKTFVSSRKMFYLTLQISQTILYHQNVSVKMNVASLPLNPAQKIK